MLIKEQKAAIRAKKAEKKQFLTLCMRVRSMFKKAESKLPENKLIYCPIQKKFVKGCYLTATQIKQEETLLREQALKEKKDVTKRIDGVLTTVTADDLIIYRINESDKALAARPLQRSSQV